jgi:hypothetical protein
VTLWDPNILPASAILTAAPVRSVSSVTFARLPAPALAINRPEGRHLVLRDQEGDRQLWMLSDVPPTAPIAALIPFDANLPLRVQAMMALWQQLTGISPSPVAPLTRQQRRRLILMLRALDGWQEHASYRELATVLINAKVRHQPRHEWLTSPDRAQIIRLV